MCSFRWVFLLDLFFDKKAGSTTKTVLDEYCTTLLEDELILIRLPYFEQFFADLYFWILKVFGHQLWDETRKASICTSESNDVSSNVFHEGEGTLLNRIFILKCLGDQI